MGLSRIRHCPGHCPGNVVFWFPSEKCCFVGDVIFGESVGRYDLPGEISINLKIPFNSKSISSDAIIPGARTENFGIS